MSSQRHKPGARYAPLLTRAKATEQQALQALSMARKRFQQEQARLQQLQDYRHDRMDSGQQHLPATLINRSAFLSRLREAIQLQEKQLARAEQEIEQARRRWQHANGDTRRYQQLIANEEIRARKHLARREQKELDELACRAHSRIQHRA